MVVKVLFFYYLVLVFIKLWPSFLGEIDKLVKRRAMFPDGNGSYREVWYNTGTYGERFSAVQAPLLC